MEVDRFLGIELERQLSSEQLVVQWLTKRTSDEFQDLDTYGQFEQASSDTSDTEDKTIFSKEYIHQERVEFLKWKLEVGIEKAKMSNGDSDDGKKCRKEEPLHLVPFMKNNVRQLRVYAPSIPPEIGQILRHRLTALLRSYHCGILRHEFLNVVEDHYGYIPDFKNLGYEAGFSGFVFSETGRLFKRIPSPLDQDEEVFFSVNSENYTMLKDVLRAAWTFIKESMLPENGYMLPLKDIPEKMSNHQKLPEELKSYGNPGKWWFLWDERFYTQNLNKEMAIRKPLIFMRETDQGMTLIEVNGTNEQTLEYNAIRRQEYELQCKINQLMVLKAPMDNRLEIRDFVRLQDVHLMKKLENMHTASDGYIRCFASAIIHPGHFYVHLGAYWRDLNELMDQMQIYYRKLDRLKNVDNPTIVWQGHLQPGYYVAVRHGISTEEWHRAQVLPPEEEQDPTVFPETYKVCLIDYGEVTIVDPIDMRYLPLKFLTCLPAQKIRCVAKLGKYYMDPMNGFKWNDADGKVLRKLLFDTPIAVNFLNKIMTKEGEPGFEVIVHVMKQGTDDIAIRHVEREVIEHRIPYRKYIVSKDDDTEIRQTLTFKKFDGDKYTFA